MLLGLSFNINFEFRFKFNSGFILVDRNLLNQPPHQLLAEFRNFGRLLPKKSAQFSHPITKFILSC